MKTNLYFPSIRKTLTDCFCSLLGFVVFCLPPALAETSATPGDTYRFEELQKKLLSNDVEARKTARDNVLDLTEQQYTKIASGLNSEDQEIRQDTEVLLRKMENRFRLAQISARLNPVEQQALQELKLRHTKLLEKMTSQSPEQRRKACAELAELDDPIALTLLNILSVDPEGGVRKSAARALGMTGKVAALPRLKQLALTKENLPADDAFGQASKMVSFSGTTPNADRMDDFKSIQQIAVEAIGLLQHPDAAKFLAEHLNNPVGTTVAVYIQALGRTAQHFIAVPALISWIDDDRKLSELGQNRRVAGLKDTGARYIKMNGLLIGTDSKATVGDLAFSTLVTMTGQENEAYGLESLPEKAEGTSIHTFSFNGNSGAGVDSKTFSSKQVRQSAVGKLKTWYESWKLKNTGKLIEVPGSKMVPELEAVKPPGPPEENGF